MYSLSNDSLTQHRILNSKQFLFITLKITVSFSIPMYRQQVWDQCDFLLVGKLFLFRYFEIIFLSWHYINFVELFFKCLLFHYFFSVLRLFNMRSVFHQNFFPIISFLQLFLFSPSGTHTHIHTFIHSFENIDHLPRAWHCDVCWIVNGEFSLWLLNSSSFILNGWYLPGASMSLNFSHYFHLFDLFS